MLGAFLYSRFSSRSRLEGLVWRFAPNVRNFPRVWRVWCGLLLQMCATFLVFGGFGVAFCSKCAQLFSCLEGLTRCIAPNVRNFSRVWRVWCGLLLQMRATFPAFGGFNALYCSKCAQLSPRLEGLTRCIAPNARNFPRVWSAHK